MNDKIIIELNEPEGIVINNNAETMIVLDEMLDEEF